MSALIVLAVILAYMVAAIASAPRLMRYAYLDKLAPQQAALAEYEDEMADYQKNPRGRVQPSKPWWVHSESRMRREARVEGMWWSVIWPIAITYYRLGETAFKQEIAAQQSTRNVQVIREYDRLLEERFDNELTAAPPLTTKAKIRSLFGVRS